MPVSLITTLKNLKTIASGLGIAGFSGAKSADSPAIIVAIKNHPEFKATEAVKVKAEEVKAAEVKVAKISPEEKKVADPELQPSIKKIMSQVHPSLKIRKDACDFINHCMTIFIGKLAKPAALSRLSIETSLSKITNDGLTKTALWAVKQEFDTHKIDPKFIKQIEDCIGKPAERDAVITLAAIIDYMIAELTELGGNITLDARRKTTTEHDIITAVSYDEELKSFIHKLTGMQF